MIESFSILSGNDILFPSARLIIHQPKLKEIGLIGETEFFTACNLLAFSKDKFLNEKDKINLSDYSNFQILMMILENNSGDIKKQKNSLFMLLTLMFPNYKIFFNKDNILFKDENNEEYFINDSNFEEFKTIVSQIFCLSKTSDQEYKAANKTAQKIIDKIMAGRKKINQEKNTKPTSIFSRYISVLSVGERKDMNDLLNYTVYQLFDEFDRFMLKQNSDRHFQAVLAGGGKGLKEPDNWFKDLYDSSS